MSIQRPVVTHDPENSETPLSEMRSWVTPNVFFFRPQPFRRARYCS